MLQPGRFPNTANVQTWKRTDLIEILSVLFFKFKYGADWSIQREEFACQYRFNTFFSYLSEEFRESDGFDSFPVDHRELVFDPLPKMFISQTQG